MSEPLNNKHIRPLVWADILDIIRRKRRTVMTVACVCAVLVGLVALGRPVVYQAEGTIRDRGMGGRGLKGSGSDGEGGVLSAMLSSMGGASDHELISLFKSRRLAAPVIERLGMQVEIAEQNPRRGILGRMWTNGKSELAHLFRVKRPVIRAPQQWIAFSDVHYPAEVPRKYLLQFDSPTQFRIASKSGKVIGTGHLDEPFVSDEMQFLLRSVTKSDLQGMTFHLKLLPLGPLAKLLATDLKIKPAEEREKIQRITFNDPERKRSSQYVNGLMQAYQDYAKSENRRVSDIQLDYLQARQKDSLEDLQSILKQYAIDTSKDLSATGIFDTEKELEYMLKFRLECCTKLAEGDLELRRLQSADTDKGGDYRSLTATNELPHPVSEALGQIRELSRRRDVLKVAIQDKGEQKSEEGQSYSLQGIDLRTAEEMFLALNNQRSGVETEIKQNRFILEQLADPAFEISSLVGSLTDPVAREIASKASAAVLNLHDSGNRSDREQERLREMLGQQRAFLKAHLMQANALLLLREDSLNKKISALQQVLVDLIQQQLNIGEQHLREYLGARVEHLKNEQSLLDQALVELRQQMAFLPQRWASEQIVMQRLKLNKTLVEEVGKLVETKNISNNLQTVESVPVDLALPPILPKPPYVLLLSLLGGALGALLSSGAVVVKGLREGVRASEMNCLEEGQRVAGKLQTHGLQWIDLLRRICSQLNIQSGDDVLLVLGHGPDYSLELGRLLVKQGLRVLRLPLFDYQKAVQDAHPGLLQVLEGVTSQPQVRSSPNDVDDVDFGGESLYVSELLKAPRFVELMKTLHQTYDVVLIVSKATADSAEADALAAQFKSSVVTVRHEKLNDLVPLFRHTNVTFVFADE